jgi:acetyltransferase-like isoleucine patch superfamily enzyme
MLRLLRKIKREYEIKKEPIRYARKIGVKVGERCRFIGIKAGTFGSEPYLVTIGSHVTITGNVQFITHDGGVWVFRDEFPEIDVLGRIIIGNNVFIGFNSIIMPGVTVGDNVVIGAGSVVTKNIPSNSVVAGVPAKVISTFESYKEKSIKNSLNTKNITPEKKREIVKNKLKIGK